MKKKITLITSILLILALAVTFVGCNKDKTEETPTTTEKVSTTEPTTKFEAPEIKDEPTTEETTEETPETTTKKSTYSSNSGSSSGSSNSGSSSSNNNSKPASKPATTKTPATTKNNSHLTDDSITPLVTNSSGGGIFLIGDGKGDELKEEDIGSADDWEPDPEMDGYFNEDVTLA